MGNNTKDHIPMNIHYLSLSEKVPGNGYWDQYLLHDLLKGCVEVNSLDGLDECIVVIPGAYQGHLVQEINRDLTKVKKVKVIVTSDEENKFPLHELQHPDMQLYATYPHATTAQVKWLPIGYPPHIDTKPKELPAKTLSMVFSGQVNHQDRINMVQALENHIPRSEVHISQGFAQGLPPAKHIEKMAHAKVAPAPRGNISPDSFRLYEALECGAIPIAQNPEFWRNIFENPPFPIVSSKDQWRGYTEDAIRDYEKNAIPLYTWWLGEKERIRKELQGNDTMTVLVPISPIPSHPSTEILEKTLESIRHHTQDQIILLFDGVREEQEQMRPQYRDHIARILWKNRKIRNIKAIVFDQHTHQVGMIRQALSQIETPLILFVEQDTPIVTDEPINMDRIQQYILSGQSNLVRFYHEAHLHPEHAHLMLKERDAGFTETIQWSSRPHIASTAFYKRILRDYFTAGAKCFTEDLLHGKVQQEYQQHGYQSWLQWRLHIYTPPGAQIKRSLHLDGRSGSPKLDNTQIF